MTKKRARLIAAGMLAIAMGFFVYAVNHPTAGFPWGNGVTYALYAGYLGAVAVLFIAPFRK